MYANRVFGTAKCVLFIDVCPHFRGVLNEGFHCTHNYYYVLKVINKC